MQAFRPLNSDPYSSTYKNKTNKYFIKVGPKSNIMKKEHQHPKLYNVYTNISPKYTYKLE